jgi:predicted transcriptional regulator
MPESGRKSPHVIRTVRIPSSLDKRLRDIAVDRQTSVNFLAEAALTKFADFDSHTEEFNYAVVKKAFLAKALEYLTDEEARDLGDWAGRGLGLENVRYYYPKADLEAVLSTYQNIGARYARMYTFRHDVEGNLHIVRLNHNMGMKWSIFYDAQMKGIFDEILGIKLDTELSTNLVTARFKK